MTHKVCESAPVGTAVSKCLVEYETEHSEKDSDTESTYEQLAVVPIDPNPFVSVDLTSTRTQQSPSRQPSQELKTPVFSTRVLQPFMSPSFLSSPSSVELANGCEVKWRCSDELEKGEINRNEKALPKEQMPNSVPLPLSSSSNHVIGSCNEASPAGQVWDNMERNLHSEISAVVENQGSMKYIKYPEDRSPNTHAEKSLGINITDDSSSRQTQTELEADNSELLSTQSSPVNRNRDTGGYLSTYIERQDSILEGLEADGGTRDFALWFNRLGPDVHCNQDLHTETGTFKQDIWHNPFKKSKSLDRYLGLKE